MKILLGPLVRILLIAIIAAAGWWALSALGVFDPNVEEQLDAARKALQDEKPALAESIAIAVTVDAPDQHDAWVLAGVAAAAQGKFDTALKRFDKVPDDSTAAVQARLRSGDLLLSKLHRLSAAEDQFRRACRLQEPPRVGVEQLALLLGIGARYHEQVPFLIELIRDEKFNNLHLFLLEAGRERPVNPGSIPIYLKNAPNDPAPKLAQAWQVMLDGTPAEAIPSLRQIIRDHPKLIDAHAKLGQALIDYGRREDIPAWDGQLPSGSEDYSDIWIVRGRYAELVGQPQVAIRCFGEAILRDPNDAASCIPFSRLMMEDGREPSVALDLEKRGGLLRTFRTLIKATQENQEPRHARRNAELAESLGLLWEAFGWSHMALRLDSGSTWANEDVSRLRIATKGLPLQRTAPGANPLSGVDLSKYPLLDWMKKTP